MLIRKKNDYFFGSFAPYFQLFTASFFDLYFFVSTTFFLFFILFICRKKLK
jgi:hypothetical protein